MSKDLMSKKPENGSANKMVVNVKESPDLKKPGWHFTAGELRALTDQRSDRQTTVSQGTGLDERKVVKSRSAMFCASIRYRWNPKTKSFELMIIDYKEDGVGALQKKFPGGASLLGETARMALNREIMAETGRLMSGDARIVHEKTYFYREGEKRGQVEHVMIFFAQELDYETRMSFFRTVESSENNECGPVYWAPLDQKFVNELFPSHKRALESLLKELHDMYAAKDRDKLNALIYLRFDQVNYPRKRAA